MKFDNYTLIIAPDKEEESERLKYTMMMEKLMITRHQTSMLNQ